MTDFAPGDVVVRVARHHSTCGHHRSGGDPRPVITIIGRHYTITSVVSGGWTGRCQGLALRFAEVVSLSEYGFCSGSFRKIRPADESFTRQMRALRPIKVREPA